MPHLKQSLLRYGFAIAIVAAAAGLTRLIHPLREQTPALLLFAAVVASAWYGGLRPGLLAAVLAVLALDRWFLPSPVEVFPGFAALLRGGVFVVGVLLIISLKGKSVRAEADRARLLNQLEGERARLAEAHRRKDQFLAMLGHELRNPLGPVRNAVQIMKRLGPADARQRQARDIIERQVAHMARLIDDLLDVSRVARGKVLLRKQRLDLVKLVRAAAEDHRPELEAEGLRLTVELPAGPLWADGDPTRLAQVLGNLLQNAGKYTDAGGQVAVRLAAGSDGRSAVLAVRDSGIGLEPGALAGVFEPFSQSDRSLDRSGGGLGLGLALVKGLVEAHGGTVSARSDGAGRGAEFSVRLPLAEAPAAGTSSAEPAGPQAAACRVLVIEDNADAAHSMQMLLALQGHEVEVAASGPAGLEAARRFHPEVVFCDIGLPGGMDGYAVARTLRGEPAGGSAYLIALTGYGQEEDQRKSQAAGFDLHLTKPVDPDALGQILANLPPRAPSAC
jgi:signal transduction histidine kinase/ActR/RegA family two-component response regulator